MLHWKEIEFASNTWKLKLESNNTKVNSYIKA